MEGSEADFIAHRHLSGSLGYSRIRNIWILQVSWPVVNRDWVKRERDERGAVGLGARHAAKLAGGGAGLTVIRWWRCAYRDPEVALRLP